MAENNKFINRLIKIYVENNTNNNYIIVFIIIYIIHTVCLKKTNKDLC